MASEHQAEVRRIHSEYEDLQQRQALNEAELTNQIERLKEAHEEELKLAENSSHQASMIAQQQQSLLKEKLDKVSNDLLEAKDQLER